MKKTGAQLLRHALEQLGIRHTFGIPGVHNTEIYDELARSPTITPILVTHEGGGAFMADAISRTSSEIGTLVIVPAAGTTHAASGIGEAGIDGVPMLIISGGIHSRSGRQYQLHAMDQHTLMSPLTKATYCIATHRDVIGTVYAAWQVATTGEPGPVFIEVPYNISNFLGDVDEMPLFCSAPAPRQAIPRTLIDQAAALLTAARQPGIFVGWGAVDAQQQVIALAELLVAPVATTLQGLSAFPGTHPLHTGMGMGAYAVPAASHAFSKIDCLLAIGTRFAEIPTGSFSIAPPENLIHVDINPAVFGANYPTCCAIEGDAREVLPALVDAIRKRQPELRDKTAMVAEIAFHKKKYLNEWLQHDIENRVNPARFFNALRTQLRDDAIIVADDGNHTFLAAELMTVIGARNFISPSDFNAMGYCVPAVIGARLVNPDRQVVGIVGDGAVMMTGVELVTATEYGVGACIFVFSDGELSQIAQAQQLPYNRKTCTRLRGLQLAPFAQSVGAEFIAINNNDDIDEGIAEALRYMANNRPVIVDVRIDYSKQTRFTQGILKTNLNRLEWRDKVRMVSRALVRRVTG